MTSAAGAPDIISLGVVELASVIRAGDLSAVAVAEAFLGRIESLNATLGAFVTIDAEAVLREAADRDRDLARSDACGPLHGVPIAIKDLVDTAGLRTTYGSSFYRNHVPAADAYCVARLRDAGAVILGKTNTHEFGIGSTTNNPWYGASLNPWDLDRSPGGSSGGSSSAVAAFMCPGSIGTDTGGSVRNPAACTGVVGFKPSNGRVSTSAVFPNAPTFDCIGSLARSVEDAAAIVDAMDSFDQSDPWSIRFAPIGSIGTIEIGSIGLGLCAELGPAEVDGAVAEQFRRAIDALSDAGGRVVEVEFRRRSTLDWARTTIGLAEVARIHGERFRASPDGFGVDVQAVLREAEGVGLNDFIDAWAERSLVMREYDRIFAGVDVLIVLTSPVVAPISATGLSPMNGGETAFGPAGLPTRQPVNLAGLPAIAIPIGLAHALPVSMQVVGPVGGDTTVLRVAQLIRSVVPWRGLDPDEVPLVRPST